MSLYKINSLIWMPILLAALGFAACKTTPSPSTPAPPKPETSDQTDSGQPPSPPAADAEKPGEEEASKTGQKSVPDTTEQPPQDSATEELSSQTPAADTGDSRAPQKEKDVSEGAPTPSQTAESKLAKARDDLRVSQATEKRIASELEQLKKSGNASDEDIRNYEAYLESVQAMSAENRRTVEKMEGAYSQHSAETKSSSTVEPSELEKLSDQAIPEEQTRDPVTELDRQLSASLTEFDAMLLKEMESIETESAAKMHDLAQEAAEAARRLKEKGVDLDGDESKSSDEASKEGEEDRQGEKAEKDSSRKEVGSEAEQGEVDDAVASRDEASGKGPGPKKDPGSRYSKEDDDIVARQLREAAENEKDPELKEKLWKEYEDYKRNTQ